MFLAMVFGYSFLLLDRETANLPPEPSPGMRDGRGKSVEGKNSRVLTYIPGRLLSTSLEIRCGLGGGEMVERHGPGSGRPSRSEKRLWRYIRSFARCRLRGGEDLMFLRNRSPSALAFFVYL